MRRDETRLVVPRVGRVPALRRPAARGKRTRDAGEGAARRRHGVLRIERQDEEPRGSLGAQLFESRLHGGRRARHPHAHGGRGSAGLRPQGERLLEKASLHLGPAADRRPSDALVDLGGLRRAKRRDRPGHELSNRSEGNVQDLGIHEELVEKGSELLAPLRPPELDEEDTQLFAAHSVREKIFGASGAFCSR